ncbi:MAG: protein translocase subunit SecD, partial [Verrucomicrobiota bacterium]
MKHKNLWLSLVIFVVAFSLWSIYPPTDRDLIEVFRDRAAVTDTNFTAIVEEATNLQKQYPDRPFDNLLAAIGKREKELGTNGIARYFPTFEIPVGKDPTRTVLYRLQQEAAGKIKLGLDLQGGMSFTVQLDTNKLANVQDKQRVVQQAVEVYRKRVDQFGVAEPMIQPAGEDRIVIQLPGLSEARKESARTTIQKAAFLEFRMIHPDNNELLKEETIPPGYEMLKMKHKDESGRETLIPYLVSKKAERGLTGKHVTVARVVSNPMTGEPEIDFELDKEGAEKFAEITKEFSPRGNRFYLLGIVLDGELYSAPRINGEIPGGRAQITGNFDIKEAFELANVLQNPLEVPGQIITEQSVDPSLGKDSIRSGITAAIVGTLAVAMFMLIYYMLAGLIANIALMLNIVILLGIMCYIETTLTLPGIAGFVLTAGMAVDANVLIYERLREELKAGKSMRGAIAAGYSRAFGTIFDSHVTTLISSIILIFMGTGPIKGFGVTLTIGVTASLFTSLVVTRLIFEFLLAKNWLKSLPMLHLIRGTNIDFMRFAKPLFTMTWLLIFIGIGYGFYRGKGMFGVEFAGGEELTLRFDPSQKVKDIDKLRKAIEVGVGETVLQYQASGAGETLRITAPLGSGRKIEETLQKEFPAAKFQVVGKDSIGATVGKEIQKTAVMASLFSLFGILVYVAFRYEV